jgi:hypothetical protein
VFFQQDGRAEVSGDDEKDADADPRIGSPENPRPMATLRQMAHDDHCNGDGARALEDGIRFTGNHSTSQEENRERWRDAVLRPDRLC